MNISDYLQQKGLSQAAFGARLGVTQGLVWQWISGHRRVTAERAVQIHQETRGKVSKHELRPDVFGQR
jgi:DNA-binding transcriptional regulator YdaS (Cro superfamily)